MYLYVQTIYQQWIQGNEDASAEDFIKFVSYHCGYDKDTVRKFLACQQWFELELERGQDGNAADC